MTTAVLAVVLFVLYAFPNRHLFRALSLTIAIAVCAFPVVWAVNWSWLRRR